MYIGDPDQINLQQVVSIVGPSRGRFDDLSGEIAQINTDPFADPPVTVLVRFEDETSFWFESEELFPLPTDGDMIMLHGGPVQERPAQQEPVSMDAVIDAVRLFAPLLPTGLRDDRAIWKLRAEQRELSNTDQADLIGLMLKLSDVLYEAGKAVHNMHLLPEQAGIIIGQACRFVGSTPADALMVLMAKYMLRARGIKNDTKERQFAATVLELNPYSKVFR